MCEFITSLNPEHEDILLNAILDIVGPNAHQESFGATLLALLEDVSGFEVMTENRAQALINYFWRKYLGQEDRNE